MEVRRLKASTVGAFKELLDNGAVELPNIKNPVKINGNETIIYAMHKGRLFEFIIDTKSLESVSLGCMWVATKSVSGERYYLRCSIKGKVKTMHRVLTKCPKKKVVDHLDGNTLNNRLSNLKVSTNGENLLNRKDNKNNASGERNIIIQKNGMYLLTTQRRFKDIELAKKARDEAVAILQKYAMKDAKTR